MAALRLKCLLRQTSLLLVLASCQQQSAGLGERARGNTTVGSGGIGSGGAPSLRGTGGEAGAADRVSVPCQFEVAQRLSPRIGTVGIVEWSTDLPELSEARIEFGLDSDYGLVAPADLEAPNYRTLLLGMKPSREYHLRLVAENEREQCVSEDLTLATGPLPNGLPLPQVHTLDEASASHGFIVTGQYNGGPAYIFDNDGDIVWWYDIGGEVMNARMSYDGKHMWINGGNVPGGNTNVHRVSMDGLEDQDLSVPFSRQHHHLTVLPDETVAFIAYGDNGCDDIKEYSPGGTVSTIVNATTAHGGSDCHVNAIEYSPADDTLIFSDLEHDNYTKVSRDGRLVWVLGGPASDYEGSGASWLNQHGLHVLGPNRILFFNNGVLGGPGSMAIEVVLDPGAMVARRWWEYAAIPALSSHVMGDAQRLPNGNTLVVYSARGVIHEVDPQNRLVQNVTWSLGGAIGYATKRQTLYGPPPK